MRVETARAAQPRRRFSLATALLTAIAVLLVVVLFSVGLFVWSIGDRNAAASFIPRQPGATPWNEQHPLSLLLIGTNGSADQHSTAGSLLVAQYQPHGKRLTVLSVPPTLWVTIPGIGPDELGHAYRDGGPRLELAAVESALRLSITYYAASTPKTLAQVVDGLGGVNVAQPAHAGGLVGRHLDGARTLAFLRVSRGLAGEFQHLHRTTLVFSALRQALSPDTIFRVPALLNTLGGSITTDFPLDQIPDLARLAGAVPRAHVRLAALTPANGTVASYPGAGQEVLVPNWQRITSEAHALFPPTRWSGKMAVRVFNGGGIPGQAAALTAWLRQAAIPVSTDATTTATPRTEVRLTGRAHGELLQLARTVAALLQAPVVLVRASGRPGIDVVIGHDYQAPVQE